MRDEKTTRKENEGPDSDSRILGVSDAVGSTAGRAPDLRREFADRTRDPDEDPGKVGGDNDEPDKVGGDEKEDDAAGDQHDK